MANLPGFIFYPGDWLRDAVSGCSLEAQGLWLRMMIIGHDSDRYGYLSMNGVAIPAGSIAQRCGCTLPQYTTLLAELTAAGVPSRTPEGIIYSRRMVKDAQKREQGAERQRKFKKLKKEGNASVTPKKLSGNAFYENENESVVSLNSKRKANYEEVNTFCSELNLPTCDSEYLFNHWEGNGWTNGGKPIEDWKRTVRAWKAAGHLPSQDTRRDRTRFTADRRHDGRSGEPGRRNATDENCICCKVPWVQNEMGGSNPNCKCHSPFVWCNEHFKCKACCGCKQVSVGTAPQIAVKIT